MLTLTDNATAIVTTLVSRQSDAADAGLRIHSTASETAGGARLAVQVTAHPEPSDHVLDASGVRLFIDEPASAVLDDKILDAGVDEAGSVSFTVLPQTV
ncbi:MULTISPECIES: Fe-S cluster assembly protein HesB [Microbacterium]|uniref:Fe-S cluster assembly protein HesB n=1 Tax=Microbacterium TaxID=33882 RepID=UPI001CBAFB20|nr:Fe-S cluster assembly protein HesB [Microbacterium sp. OVT16B]